MIYFIVIVSLLLKILHFELTKNATHFAISVWMHLVRLWLHTAPFQRYCRFLCSWPRLYSTLIFGVFPLDRSPTMWLIRAGTLSCEIIFEVFQPVWETYHYAFHTSWNTSISERHRLTDGRWWHNRALCSIAQ